MQVVKTKGEGPTARFGHTITMVSPRLAILYGGAIGQTEKYTITGVIYKYDMKENLWSPLKAKGDLPPNRAAHAACCVQENKLVIFGGAMAGGGSLAPDDLHMLEVSRTSSDEAQWLKIMTEGVGPGKRYGHTMVFSEPHLMVFGGNTGSESVNDVWILAIDKTPLTWVKVICSSPTAPPARVYHSAALCSLGSAAGMVVIFGGRGHNGVALNDTWGFRKHRDGRFDWVKAPYKNHKPEPSGRYQVAFFLP
jgi:protein phosphatase